MPRHVIVNLEPFDDIIKRVCAFIQTKTPHNGWKREAFTLDDVPQHLGRDDKLYLCGHGHPVAEGKMAGYTPSDLAELLEARGLETVGQVNLIMCGGGDPDTVVAHQFAQHFRTLGFKGRVVAYNRNLVVGPDGSKHFSVPRTRALFSRLDGHLAALAAKGPPTEWNDLDRRLFVDVQNLVRRLEAFTAVKDKRDKIQVTID